MKLFKIILAVTVVLLFGTGCMHTHNLENPAESHQIDNGVQVSIGAKEVKVDEVINVFQKSCTKTRVHPRAQPIDHCKLTKVGQAKVAKVIDQDSAIVLPMGGLKIDSTMRVEKSRD